jgi:hypothetical protein
MMIKNNDLRQIKNFHEKFSIEIASFMLKKNLHTNLGSQKIIINLRTDRQKHTHTHTQYIILDVILNIMYFSFGTYKILLPP